MYTKSIEAIITSDAESFGAYMQSHLIKYILQHIFRNNVILVM